MNSESLTKLPNLTAREGEPIEETIERSLPRLPGLTEKAIVHLRVIGGPGQQATQNYSISLTSSGAHLQAQFTPKATLVLIASYDDFTRILNGSYSPLQAYLDGTLKPLGDIEMGKRIISTLSGSEVPMLVCPILLNESWHVDGPGYGHITLSGKYFTSSGNVEIVYNWGGGFYQQLLVADYANGAFTTTQDQVPCGDIPGMPGVGVIVTATDIATSKYVTKSYATPCQ